MRVGIGYDIHRLSDERKLVLGGVLLDHPKGLLGHSDADVLLHAIADALLGSVAAGDIGTHFPDTDDKYKGVSSLELLGEVAKILKDRKIQVVNVDSVIIAEEPKLSPHIHSMRENIAAALEVPVENISVKATTNERMGETGRQEAIAAYAVAMVGQAPRAVDRGRK